MPQLCAATETSKTPRARQAEHWDPVQTGSAAGGALKLQIRFGLACLAFGADPSSTCCNDFAFRELHLQTQTLLTL